EGKKTARAARDVWRQSRTLRVEVGRHGQAACFGGELVVPADSYVPEQIDGIVVNPSVPAQEQRTAKFVWLMLFGAQMGLGFLDPMLRSASELLDLLPRKDWNQTGEQR